MRQAAVRSSPAHSASRHGHRRHGRRRGLGTPVDGSAKPKFRADIEGLRAVAVLFVLIMHAGVTQLPGGFVGVDVFFVISGFLMTKILLDAASSAGGLSLRDFYARRVKRLLPASALVLVVTALAAWLFLPSSRLYSIGMDIAAAATYIVNWRLAEESVDYLNATAAPSPVQHFWSLSVEEQYYIVWPLLLFAVFWVLRNLFKKSVGAHARAVVLYSTLAIAIPSLSWSVYESATDPSRAYFATTTRLWELALGGLVAVFFVRCTVVPRVLAAVLSWLGLAMILGTGLFLQTAMPFPGGIALVPTVGTALIIALAPVAGPAGPAKLLGARPLMWIGTMSYSLYLWHWPFVVIGGYLVTDGLRDTTVLEKVLLTALAFAPAYLSLNLVENPIRRSGWVNELRGNTYFVGFAATATALCAAMIAALSIGSAPPASEPSPYSAASAPAGDAQADSFGAAALGADPRTSPAGVPADAVNSITPRPEFGASDNPSVYQDGCHLDESTVELNPCTYGDPTTNTTVALVGDSHAAQWVPPLIEVAKERGWKLVTNTKSACPYLDVTLMKAGREYTACQDWNTEITSYLTGPDRPDAVFVSYSRYKPASGDVTDGATARLRPLVDAGMSVFLLRDTPWFPTNVPDCVSAHEDQLTRCATPRDAALARRDDTQPAVIESVPGAQLVDLTDFICPADSCSPVIGGALVYRDNNHMTATYARTLTPRLSTALPRIE